MTPNILIVEDSDSFAALIEGQIKHDFMDTVLSHRVSSISEARNVMLKLSFQCIILDLTLPDCDGVDSVSKIRKYDLKTPIIVLSGYDKSIEMATLARGAVEFIPKDELQGFLSQS